MKRFILLISLFFLSLETTDKSLASYYDRSRVGGNATAAVCFEECEVKQAQEVKEAQEETGPQLLYYSRNDKTAVGFVLKNISEFDSFDFLITYDHQGVTQATSGNKNINGQDLILEEWILLGSCSSGGTCFYHEAVNTVNISINLFKDSVSIKTLNGSLDL